MRVTDKYVLFWSGELSNFYKTTIMGGSPKKPIKFCCSEQVFMWLKAIRFGDEVIAEEILKETSPKKIQNLGRRIRGYDESVWETYGESAMFTAVYLKFKQNPALQEMLLQEEWRDKHFVEASPIDTKWGIGLVEDNPLCEDEANWKGRNLLGKCLDKVRETLLRERADA